MSLYCPNCGTTIHWEILHTYTRETRKCIKCKQPVNLDLQLEQARGTIRELALRGRGLSFDNKGHEGWVKRWMVFDLITHLNLSLTKASDFLKNNNIKFHTTKSLKKMLNEICDESGLHSFDEMRSKLTIETIPFETSSINLHTGPFSDGSLWKKISSEVKERSDGHCELCGKKNTLNCHEVWQFSEYNHIQRLVGFMALCQKCHLVKHNTLHELTRYSWEDATRHIAEVNGWTYEQAEKYREYQRWIQSVRYKKGHWKVDFSYIEKKIIEEAKAFEKIDQEKAIDKYNEVMRILNKIEVLCREGRAVRTTPYPLNRLTLLFEREERFKQCLKEIEIYEKYQKANDKVGLTKSDRESIKKRKARVTKKFSQNHQPRP